MLQQHVTLDEASVIINTKNCKFSSTSLPQMRRKVSEAAEMLARANRGPTFA